MQRTLIEKEKYDLAPEPYVSIEWSAFLDKLLEENISDLTELSSKDEISFLQKQLDTLLKAMKIVKGYKNPKYIEVGWFNGELYDVYSATISEDELAQARLKLLLAIPPKLIPQLSITKKDKETLHKKFEDEVSKIDSEESLGKYVNQYENHPLLTYQRHPYHDSISRLFNAKKAPNSKIKFMQLVERKRKALLKSEETRDMFDLYIRK